MKFLDSFWWSFYYWLERSLVI